MSESTKGVGSRWRRSLAALIGVLLAFGVGCEGESEEARALSEARRRLEAVSIAAQHGRVAETQRAAYQEAMSRLRPIASDAQAQYAPSAMRLLAGAEAGMGALSAGDAIEAGEGALGGVTAARRTLDLYEDLHVLADAISAPEPTTEIASLRSEIAERRSELAGLEEQRADLTERIDSIEAESEGLAEQAKSLREQAGVVRSEALPLGPAERSEQIERAVAIEDEANASESASERLRARMGRLHPEREALQSEIDRVERQISLLRAAIDQMEAIDQAGEAQAEENRLEAEQVAERFAEQAAAIERTLQERYNPLIDEAVSRYEEAASLARRAASASSLADTQSSERLAAGRHLQSVGMLREAQSTVLLPAALLFERAAASDPPLPESERYAETASGLRERIGASEEAAQAAYAEAKEAFTRARVRGEAGEHIQRLLERMQEQAPADDASGADQQP